MYLGKSEESLSLIMSDKMKYMTVAVCCSVQSGVLDSGAGAPSK